MEQGFYRYKVGTIEVTALSDGVWEKIHDPSFIKNATLDKTKAALAAVGLTTDFVPFPFTLRIRSGVGQRIRKRTCVRKRPRHFSASAVCFSWFARSAAGPVEPIRARSAQREWR